MQSKAKTVTEYLNEIPEDRKEALIRIRKLCKTLLAGYEEGMEYGGPVYKRDGVIEVGFASQKQSINFYILKQGVMKKHLPRLKGLSVGKGVIRYPKPERIDFAVISDLLADTARSREEPC